MTIQYDEALPSGVKSKGGFWYEPRRGLAAELGAHAETLEKFRIRAAQDPSQADFAFSLAERAAAYRHAAEVARRHALRDFLRAFLLGLICGGIPLVVYILATLGRTR